MESTRARWDLLRDVRSWPLRKLLPPRWGWLRLVVSPSSAVLVVALVLTCLAKVTVLREIEGIRHWPLHLLWAISVDVVVYLGLAAVFAAGEAKMRWLMAITIPISLLALGVALINAAYLSVAGEQITWHVVTVGIERFRDFWSIVVDHVRYGGVGLVGVVPLFFVVAAVPVHVLLSRRAGAASPVARGRDRAHAAATAAVAALMVCVVAPTPDAVPVRKLGGNAAVATYVGFLVGENLEDVEFTGYDPPALVAPEQVKLLRAGPRPNVVLLVLESTRWDFTSLAGDASPARTPHLLALSRAGASAHTARAVLPHTTKSLFSMLCGRLPLMQRTLWELSNAVEAECLAHVLRGAGYTTAFFQSALGSFEDRPRLVYRMGFEHFEAWEEIRGEPLGYLASDDESVGPAFDRWLGEEPGEPFFVTLLTSAAHHPYRLPANVLERARESGAPTAAHRYRYALLVEAQDHLLGTVLATLEARGLRESTIVVVAGDHGEGFGEKGVRQHDNNYYEEGLRVPLVFAGPGVPHREIEGNVSLMDLAPSILYLLGAESIGDGGVARGVNVFDAVPDLPRWFTCWYDFRCEGFVLGDQKVVRLPTMNKTFRFDLAQDPDEQRALRLRPDLRPFVSDMRTLMRKHRSLDLPWLLDDLRPFGEWHCPARATCRHPASPAGGFFEPPTTD